MIIIMFDYIWLHIFVSAAVFLMIGTRCEKFPGKHVLQCAILAIVWPLTLFILTLKYIVVTIDEVLK